MPELGTSGSAGGPGQRTAQVYPTATRPGLGGRQVWEALQEAVDLEPGQTSPDGKWTLVTVSCLGVCGVGPVIVIDDQIYGSVAPAQVPEILSHYE